MNSYRHKNTKFRKENKNTDIGYYLDILSPISVPKTKLSAKQPNSAIGDSTILLTNIAVQRKLIAWQAIIGINFFKVKFFIISFRSSKQDKFNLQHLNDFSLKSTDCLLNKEQSPVEKLSQKCDL